MHKLNWTLGLIAALSLPTGTTAQNNGGNSGASMTHENVIYGMHGGLALLMDVYQPAEPNGHALLYIAGSGWHWPTDYGAGGIKDAVTSGGLGGGSVELFADAGFTVFVINHRQAPLFRYPAAVEDARRAVRYIRHHGDEYGVTEDAIAAFGISSGAHLVLMLALGDGPGDPKSADEVERHSSKVDVVAAYAGPTDLTAEDWVKSIGASYVASFVGAPPGGFAGGAHAQASPITHVDGDDPPVLLIHGDSDEVVPVAQARTLAASLRQHRVEVKYVEIADGGHDFDKVLNHGPNELPSFPAMALWLREHLPAGARHIDHYFDSDGVRIRYIDIGPRGGEPVVLVHGFTQRIETCWGKTGLIDALDDEYRVIALDLRGHGKSDKPHDTEAYGNEMVADIVRLLDHVDIRKTHIVGYSMGGRIVAKLVADHPERVKSAMPSGTSMEPGSEDDKALGERLAKSLEESGSIRPVLERFTADGSMTEQQIEQIVAMVRETNDTKALAAVLGSIDEFLPDRAKLEANPVPCLSIIGEHDPNLPITKRTAQYMANLDIHVIKGANHLTAFRDPSFVAAIKTFIGKHASSTGTE